MKFVRAFVLLVVLVAAISCGSHHFEPASDLTTTREALTAAGGIVPTSQISTGITAGPMDGGFSVTADGQAAYQIPIWAPAGVLGMQPSLSLNYNSGSGSGALGVGVGWSLSGFPLSQITRCPKTLAVDGYAAPISYTDSVYCIDGKRLIPSSSSSFSEFRTERDEFSKIVLNGPSTDKPSSFTVYMKNGWVLTYGGQSTSKLTGTQKILTVGTSGSGATVQSTNPGVTYAWALDSVKDRTDAIAGLVANKMTITYTNLSSGTTNRYGSRYDFVEIVPASIDYSYGASGATSHRSLKFVYASAGRADAMLRFISGLPVKSTNQLARIELYGPNPTSIGLLKQYVLNYEPTPAPISGRPRLASVQECDGATSKVCKAPTSFAYEDGTNDYVKYTQSVSAAGERAPDMFAPFTIADLNGDGKDDIIYRDPIVNAATTGTDHYSYHLSNLTAASAFGPASGSSGEIPFQAPQNLVFHATGDNHIRYDGGLTTFDLDGDGRRDISILQSPGASRNVNGAPGNLGYRDIFRFNGALTESVDPDSTGYDQLFQELTTFPHYVADMNGDGLPEFVDIGDQFYNTNLTRFAPLLLKKNNNGTLSPRTPLQVGTGATLRYCTVRARPASYAVEPGRVVPASGDNVYIADIDGSGRQALLVVDGSYAATDRDKVVTTDFRYRAHYTDTPPSLPASVLTTLQVTDRSKGSRYIMLDVNGDGLTDAVRLDIQTDIDLSKGIPATYEATANQMRINTGSGFDGPYAANQVTNTDPRFWITLREDSAVNVADMNQDGLPDIVLMGGSVAPNGTTTDRSTIQVLKANKGPDGPQTGAHFAAGVSPKSGGNEIAVAAPVLGQTTPPIYGPAHGYVGDFNGDGLADMLIARSPSRNVYVIDVYVHQGKKADLLKSVTTSLGARITIDHATIADPAVYKLGRYGVTVPGPAPTQPTWEPNADCRYPLRCETKGRWVVKSYDVTTDHGAQGPPETHTFEYAEGRTDALRGWLGFAQRIETDAHHGKIITTYENWRREGNNYPYAFLPKQHGYIVQDIDADTCDACYVYRTITTNTYGYVENIVNGNKFFRTRLTNSVTAADVFSLQGADSNLVPQFFGNSVGWTSVQSSNLTVSAFTAYDDPIDSQVVFPTETVTTHNDYFTDDPVKWLLGRPSTTTTTSTAAGKVGIRIRDFTYDGDTKLTKTVTVRALLSNVGKSVTTLIRGPAGLGQVTQEIVAGTATADDPRGAGTPLTRTTTTVYDTVDGVTPTSVTQSGLTTSYAYHGGLGVPVQVADFKNIVTTRKFDGFGRPVSEQTPQRGTMTYGYEAALGLPAQASPAALAAYNAQAPAFAIQRNRTGGERDWITYNQQGHEILHTVIGGDGMAVQTLTTFTNFIGQVASVSLPSRGAAAYQVTSFFHDNVGRVTRKTLPDGKYFTHSYDAAPNGILATTTDPRGYWSRIMTDDRGRLGSSIEWSPSGSDVVTNYQYGPFGDIAKVSLPPVLGINAASTVNGSTTYAYDDLGRLMDINDADRGHTTRSYNPFNELVKEVDANNRVTTFKRDDLGRVTETSATGDPGVNQYKWDPANGKGKLDYSLSFDRVRKTYTYDTFGLPDKTIWNIQGKDFAFKSTWDTNGRLVYLDYPTMGTQTFQIEYDFDQAGQVNGVHRVGDNYNTWSVVHRTDDNRIDQELAGSGFTTNHNFHPTRRYLESIQTTHPTLSPLVNLTYAHDDGAGNVTGRTDGIANTNETFQYGDHDVLYKWNWISPAMSETIDPSVNGTIKSRMDLPTRSTYSFDYFSPGVDASGTQLPRTGGMHAVQATTGAVAKKFTYDAIGNQTRTFSGATVTYNSFNLPKTIVGGPTTAYFTYDAEGNRATKTTGPVASPTIASYAGDLYERRAMPTGETIHVLYIPAAGRIVAQETWTRNPSASSLEPIRSFCTTMSLAPSSPSHRIIR